MDQAMHQYSRWMDGLMDDTKKKIVFIMNERQLECWKSCWCEQGDQANRGGDCIIGMTSWGEGKGGEGRGGGGES